MTNQDWDPSVLGGIDPADASSPYTVYKVHNYKILESIPGKASKYSVWNYGRPKNLNGFISENRNLWMPQHKKLLKIKDNMARWISHKCNTCDFSFTGSGKPDALMRGRTVPVV